MKTDLRIKTLPLLFFFFLLFSVQSLFAQSHTLSGKVIDERNRQAMAFVNVVVNDGLNGVITDIDGRYEITANEPIMKVKFSSIGYEPKEVTLQDGQKKCNVALTPKTFELWNPATNNMQAHPGRYELLYGTSSRTEDLNSFVVELN